MEINDNDDTEHMEDVNMDRESSQAPEVGDDPEEPVNKFVKSSQGQGSRLARSVSVDMIGDERSEPPTSHSLPTPHSGASSIVCEPSTMDKHERPPIDEQVAQVTKLSQQPPQDKQKGYIVDKQWLNRAVGLSTASSRSGKQSKVARQEPLGPVDNSRLYLDTDPSNSFKDECGKPFVPLKPGLQIGEDFEVIPQEAWELLLKWYGTTASSPVITRYCHNTSTSLVDPNPQYEIYPPIFTILKLPDRSGGITPSSLKEKDAPPVKILASRHELFQKFLARVKAAAGIPLAIKVRVWRILVGLQRKRDAGMLTPAQSRSASPMPNLTVPVDPGDHLVMDMNDFISLQEGSHREALEAKDETANDNYNGHSNLDLVGLSQEGVIVLEEQVQGPAGGEWASATAADQFAKNGVLVSVTQNGNTAVSNSLKPKTVSTNGRTSPGLAGMLTRGRAQKNGKPRGVVGLANLGNTCYMNSALQCVRSVEELTQYFLSNAYKKELNPSNPLGHNGEVARVYASLLKELYSEAPSTSFSPRNFKTTIGKYGPSFSGYGQQDSQEFLLFLLDGLQEDLNRIQKKPYIEKPDSTDEMVNDPVALQEMADKCWDIYKARNDSIITDLFAGMYKSTVICPICEKVSIIFDPFNNLTLQLPVENVWTKKIMYFPQNSQPIGMIVDMDRNASWAAFKDYVAKRGGTDPKRLIVVEIYRNKIFKYFDERKTLGEENIQENDLIGVYELENVPTNWPPVKKAPRTRSSYPTDSEDDLPEEDSDMTDELLVSVFHRVRQGPLMRFALLPSFIVVNREEAQSLDIIHRKVLAAAAAFTTKDLFQETSPEDRDDSEAVLMSRDDADSSDSKVNAVSVEGEDGIVEISMREAEDEEKNEESSNHPNDSYAAQTTLIPQPLPRVLERGNPLSPRLKGLFEMKYWHGSTVVPIGYAVMDNAEHEIRPLESKEVKANGRKANRFAVTMTRNNRSGSVNSDSSEEGHPESPQHVPILNDSLNEQDHSDSENELPAVAELRQHFGRSGAFHTSRIDEVSNQRQSRKLITYSRKASRRPVTDDDSDVESGVGAALLRPGDAILVDWFPDIFETLFHDPSIEPAADFFSTREPPRIFPDAELDKRRRIRANRKKNGVSLGDCLDEFGKSEILSENDAWYCPRCKAHRRASKKFELWKSPDILVIHLKRFSAQGRFRDKLDVFVDFPLEGLDLSERVIVKENNKSMLYDLFAVDNHYGGLGGGHYTAYAKNFFTEDWYDYNGTQ